MKTKSFIAIGLLCISFAFSCGSKNANAESESPEQVPRTEASQELDTNLDKYLGLYVFGNNFGSYSIGKFPENSKVHTQTGDKYPPLDKKFIGKYFLSKDKFSYETIKVTEFAGGYIAPPEGDIIIGVAADGSITIQHYNNYGKAGDVMDFNVQETQVYGKFIKRSDGKYDLSLNNALYVWTKGL
jgi:hypothetical protein